MNMYDIAIGFIIGVGVERATRISYAVQKAIAKAKAARKAEAERKKKLLEGDAKKNDEVVNPSK